MALGVEDVEREELFLQEINEDLQQNSGRGKRAWRIMAALLAAACLASFGAGLAQHKPQTRADTLSPLVWEEVGACTVTTEAEEQYCNPAKPIGDAMRSIGQNSPEACAAVAAADNECGAWINYIPFYQPGVGGCHCVVIGAGNDQCTQRAPQEGWSIYTTTCTGSSHEVPSAAIPVPAVSAAKPAATPAATAKSNSSVAQQVAMPSIRVLAPELVKAGRCVSPLATMIYEDMACEPVRLIGTVMRDRGNSVAACAAAAAADPGCGTFINYSPDFEGQGACHCVNEDSLQCKRRKSAHGFKVYQLTCPQAHADLE